MESSSTRYVPLVGFTVLLKLSLYKDFNYTIK